MTQIGGQAVVLGASMAGLLAARVLADTYQRVTVVERDPLPPMPANRKGVPQGRHAHLLVPRGAQVLDALLPGLLADLAAGGAPMIGDYAQLRFAPGGHLLRLEGRPPQPFICQASRPYLEAHVRTRIRALPTVQIADRCDIAGLVTTADRDRVTGYRSCAGTPVPRTP
jgi:2-polyprenyl-6-methoxyphenol hydroxylase-like FAD-dependent oxidoreductase